MRSPILIAIVAAVAMTACSSDEAPAAVETDASAPTDLSSAETVPPTASSQPDVASTSVEPAPSTSVTTASVEAAPTTATAAPTTTTAAPIAVLIGAGDIANSADDDDMATAQLIAAYPDAIVFTTGDNVYQSGTAEQFSKFYEPTWGAFKDRTKPTVGNHDERTAGAAGYFEYFGAAAGTPGQGWYSYDLGPWHVIDLNSECGGDGLASCDEQMRWLRADLAATSAECMIAIWHKPVFNAGRHHGEDSFADEWAVLDEAGADVVLNGHDHNYQRFTPQDASGVATADGMREFVVGTGGAPTYEQTSDPANLEEFYQGHGVLKLDLAEDSYAWSFISTEGGYGDTGTGRCVP